MGDLLGVAVAIMARAESAVEATSQNLVNSGTAGYKRKFVTFLQEADGSSPASGAHIETDFSIGKQIETHSPTDLALSATGYFVVRSGSGLSYTRNGAFHRGADGALVTASGSRLQAQGGGDVVVPRDTFQVQADGTVIVANAPAAKVAVVDFADTSSLSPAGGGVFVAPEIAARDVSKPFVRQGVLEASNVSSATEMVTMMEALRSAESGQRLVQTYDDLMGRAIATFGQIP